jgi:thiamine-phosphate pyrophosphorylase
MNRSRPAVKNGLYALTPSGWPAERLLKAVDQAIAGGVSLIQYRDKPRPDADLARALVKRCRAADLGLIINDDVDLARSVQAHGVHLGRDDADPGHARQILGQSAIIGVSCYNDLARAKALVKTGVDYLAFGSVFTSPTKPAAVACDLEILTHARSFGLPVVAIGGVSLENAPLALAAGADLLAVISDLFEAPDIQVRAGQYQALIRAAMQA